MGKLRKFSPDAAPWGRKRTGRRSAPPEALFCYSFARSAHREMVVIKSVLYAIVRVIYTPYRIVCNILSFLPSVFSW